MKIVGSEWIYDEGADGVEKTFPVLRRGGVRLGWIEDRSVLVGDCGKATIVTNP